jgi:hypothetical protein
LHYRKGQNNFDKFRLDSCVYYRQSLTAFQEAETTLIQFLELQLELVQDFMKVYSALREPEKANSYREQGRELLKQLLNNQSPQQRRKLLAKFNSFRQLDVDILLQQHQPIQALEEADRIVKNPGMTDFLDIFSLQVNPKPRRAAYADIYYFGDAITNSMVYEIKGSAVAYSCTAIIRAEQLSKGITVAKAAGDR